MNTVTLGHLREGLNITALRAACATLRNRGVAGTLVRRTV